MIADRRSNEVGAIGVKALLYEQIDSPQVHVTKVDGDLFGVTRSITKLMNFRGHPALLPSCWMVYGCPRDGFKSRRAATAAGGTRADEGGHAAGFDVSIFRSTALA